MFTEKTGDMIRLVKKQAKPDRGTIPLSGFLRFKGIREADAMDEREQREIEKIEALIMQAEAKRDQEREEIREAWENFKQTLLEALRIPSIVSWLAAKLEKLTGK